MVRRYQFGSAPVEAAGESDVRSVDGTAISRFHSRNGLPDAMPADPTRHPNG